MLRKSWFLALLVVSCLMLPATAGAKLPKSDRKAAKQMLSGTLYMRLDAPSEIGTQPFGIYYSPLVEISPDSTNTDADQGFSFGMYHAGSTRWGIRINDPVRVDELEFEGNEVEIELDGMGAVSDEHTVIKFIHINTLADFERAFGQAFSRVPLQVEHDEWSPEIKEAIAQRKLLDGMTRRQVYYVTGAPEKFERSEEDGKEIEIWWLRQDKGMKFGFFRHSTGEQTGMSGTIRFEDGILVGTGTSGTRSEFSLED